MGFELSFCTSYLFSRPIYTRYLFPCIPVNRGVQQQIITSVSSYDDFFCDKFFYEELHQGENGEFGTMHTENDNVLTTRHYIKNRR